MKRLIPLFGLLVLLLALPANAQGAFQIFEDVGYDNQEFNYNLIPAIGFGVNLTEDEPIRVEFRTFASFDTFDSTIFVKFIPYPTSSSPQTDAYVDVDCVGGSGQINLSQYNNWVGASWAIEGFGLWSGNLNQSIRSSNNESTSMYGSTTCVLTARNQDLFATFYAFTTGTVGIDQICPNCDQFSIPNDAMAAIVQRTSSTVSAVFDAIDISIMVFVFILVVFILVAIYKLFKYFAKPKQI